jgi:hypothetical protein
MALLEGKLLTGCGFSQGHVPRAAEGGWGGGRGAGRPAAALSKLGI